MSDAKEPLERARTSGWSGRLWSAITPIYDAILEHPFITGLVSGDLDVETFRHYIIQDELYIRDYAKAISVLAGKAPTWRATQEFTDHATSATKYESELHESVVRELGGRSTMIDDAKPSPTALAYINFIRSHVHGSSFVDGVASILPCFWIYAEVGIHLGELGSKNKAYQNWIDSYQDPAYVDAVIATLDIMNGIGAELGPQDENRTLDIFVTGSKYEWLFWDAAYRRETWML